MSTLFDLQIDEPAEAYSRLLEDHRADDRAVLDALYARASLYLDANFKDQFARATHDRFFELRLANVLLDHGFELEKGGEFRPDFQTRTSDGRKLWIEAVTLSWGQPDNPDRPQPFEKRAMRPSPVREALLRHTGALKAKRDKFRVYLDGKVISPDDVCVVAMSSGGLHPNVEGVGLPRVVSAVLPFGDETVTIDRRTGEVVAVSHAFRPEIRNARDKPVATTAFLDPEQYGLVSAVLHDTSCISTWRGDLQPSRWVTVHNPTATVRASQALFPWGRRFVVDAGREHYTLNEL